MKKLLLSALAVSCLAVGSANAQVVFNDTFSTGSTGADAGYFLIRNNSATAGIASSIAGGVLAMDYASTGTTTNAGIFKKFTTQSLAATGDSITVSFDLNFNQVASAGGSSFRIMLGSTSTTGTATNFDAFNSDTLFTALRLANGTGTGAGFRSHIAFDGASIAALTGTNNNFTQAVNTNSITSVSYSITRTGAGVDITASLNGTSIGSTFTRTGAEALTSFDFFGISQASSTVNLDFTLDNVNLSVAAIPEPSTYTALVGLAVVGFAATRRRRS